MKEFQRLLVAFSKRTDEWDEQISDTMEDSVNALSESMEDSLNIDQEGNPLNRLKAINNQIQHLRDIIQKKEGNIKESAKGTMKGFDFEDEVVDDLNFWQHYPDSFEALKYTKVKHDEKLVMFSLLYRTEGRLPLR